MLQETITFLQKLHTNNSKEWMDKNRDQYKNVKEQFENFVGELIPKINDFDKGLRILSPKDCTYRINRDIRFSKNKEPYKTWMGAFFGNSKKNGTSPGYYFHIDYSGEIILAGGQYMLEPDALLALRQKLAQDKYAKEFRKIISNKKLLKHFPSGITENEQLKTAPKGFPKDHSNIDLLRYKGFAVFNKINGNQYNDKKLVKEILQHFEASYELTNWLRKNS